MTNNDKINQSEKALDVIAQKEQETAKKFDNLKPYYDETWDKGAITMHVGLFDNDTQALEEAYKNATKHLEELLNKRQEITNRARILDIGSGSGRTLVDMCDKYDCIGVGIDISAKSVESANEYLTEINTKRTKAGKESLDVRFINGSASKLDGLLPSDAQFTHAISQDAMFLVVNKDALFKNIYRLLESDGVLALADFLHESGEFVGDEERLVKQLVNWDNGLSYSLYQDVLTGVGFDDVYAEDNTKSMIKTYEILTDRMTKEFVQKDDEIYTELRDRYKMVVDALQSKKMGWGMFTGIKK